MTWATCAADDSLDMRGWHPQHRARLKGTRCAPLLGWWQYLEPNQDPTCQYDNKTACWTFDEIPYFYQLCRSHQHQTPGR
jgi:hypothetical protein